MKYYEWNHCKANKKPTFWYLFRENRSKTDQDMDILPPPPFWRDSAIFNQLLKGDDSISFGLFFSENG